MRYVGRSWPVLLGVACVAVPIVGGCSRGGGASTSASPRVASFTLVGSMAEPRADFTATVLSDGRVLVLGGSNGAAAAGSTELFDPIAATFSVAGPLNEPRSYHVAARLPGGPVLVAGGWLERSAELFDPVTASCIRTGDPATSHFNATATPLAGAVLVIGGMDAGIARADVERYDAITGLFAPAGSLLTPRSSHTATPLADGRVLVVGGEWGSAALASAELYDPAGEQSTATPPMQSARTGHTATRLLDGTVLIAGGAVDEGALATAEIYDPATGGFTATGSMHEARYAHAAALLRDGRVLVAGGYDFLRIADYGGILDGAELYDPATRSFSPAARLHFRRAFAASVSLVDGSVLVIGGIHDWSGQSGYLESAELYR